jgi:hypothetical protein
MYWGASFYKAFFLVAGFFIFWIMMHFIPLLYLLKWHCHGDKLWFLHEDNPACVSGAYTIVLNAQGEKHFIKVRTCSLPTAVARKDL